MKDKWTRYEHRKLATRKRLFEHRGERPRLSVHRSLKYIYAQLIDDAKGVTLATASSMDKELKAGAKSTKSIDAAKKVGEAIAARAASSAGRSSSSRALAPAAARPRTSSSSPSSSATG